MAGRLAVLGFLAFGSSVEAQDATLERARWLSGCWELRSENRLTVEMWMPPAGSMLIGGSRTVVNGTVREFEHLRITSGGGTLTYIALPSGQNETAFEAREISDSAIVFENLAHDFPQRIIYRRRGADSIVARIEGPGPNNGTRAVDFPMRRASCSP